MGQLTTHVLDTMHGCPASGVRVVLYRLNGEAPQMLRTVQLNADGRTDQPLLAAADFTSGRYRLVFSLADYFRGRGVSLPEPPFFEEVPVEFGISDVAAHHHVPLLMSPWSYSTYRGS